MASSRIRKARFFLFVPVLGVLANCSTISLNELTGGPAELMVLDASKDAEDAQTVLPDASDAESTTDAHDASSAKDADAVDASDACSSPPATWTSARIADADAGCSSGFQRTFLKNPRSAADACDCSCQGAPSNPCEYAGNVPNVKFGLYGGTCSNGFDVNALGCTTLTDWSSVNSISGVARPPNNVACPARADLPEIVADEKLDVCVAGNWEETCAPGACVMHDGIDRPCPDGFPVRRELTAKEDIGDGRACGDTCACKTAVTACTDATITYYTDSNCTTGGRAAILDGTCRGFNSFNFTPKTFQYHANPDVPGCSPTTPTTTLTGTVTSKKQITLCCANP